MRFMHDVEFDALALAATQRVLRHRYLTTQDLGDAVADTVLDFVLLDHATQSFPQPLDLEAFGDAPHECDGVDGCADFFEETTDEARLVHRVVEQIFP